ncbi:MAG: FecR domain-containing protein [Proteobacteria bacterium]|nr:FecR domain-containing protein [Pseudomonadota bacterium]
MSSEDIDLQAADWLARLDDNGTSEELLDEFQRWCQADPRHHAAYLRLQHVWGRLDRLRALHRPEEELDRDPPAADLRVGRGHRAWPDSEPSSRARQVYLPIGLAASLLAAIGVLWIWQHRDNYFAAEMRYTTALGGFQRVVLSDGSVVQINTDSEVQVVFRKTKRDIELLRGEASFEVARDASRPFVVAANGTAVRAVGTSFNVHKIPAGLEVMIVEGAVAVGPTASLQAPDGLHVVGAGRFAIAHAAQLEVKDVDESEVARKLAWQRGMLGFNGQTLAEVVDEFNRYNQRKLEIDEPAVGKLRIGGYFRATNVDAFVRVIEERFGVSASRLPDRIVLRRAPSR